MTVKYWILTQSGKVKLNFPYNKEFIERVKALSDRQYLPDEKAWMVSEQDFYDLMESCPESVFFVDARKVKEQPNLAADPDLENSPLPTNDEGRLPEGKFYVSWDTPDTLRLDFAYNEEFVASVKALEGSFYYKDDQAWFVQKSEFGKLEDYYAPATFVFLGAGMESLRYKVPPFSVELAPLPDKSFKTEPFPHQKEAIAFALAHPNALIADDQGMGKSCSAINAMLLRKEEAKKCLVVCGVNTVKYNWVNEIRIHSDEKSALIDGPNSLKRQQKIGEWLASDAYFGIINIEALRSTNIQQMFRQAVEDKKIGAIIVDEVHKAKNPHSIQGKALVMLRPPYRIGLSGTPINKPEELWNVLSWLDVEKMKEWPWKHRYCVFGGYQDKAVIAYKNHVELRNKLQSCMIRRRKDDVLDLPPKIHQQQYVELSGRQREIYNEALTGLITSYDEIIKMDNPLTETLRLRQITDGLFTDSNPKLERVQELLSEEIIPSGYKAIIFSNWRKTTDIYFNALKEYNPAYINGTTIGAKREEQVNKFQTDDNCKVIIGTIGAMGTGITLNRASYVIFIDQSWVPLDNEQAEDRAHRIGTKGTVTVINLLAKDTIDEYIEDHVAERREAFSYFVEAGGVNPRKAKEIFADFIEGVKTE